jgi:hypothetical protein
MSECKRCDAPCGVCVDCNKCMQLHCKCDPCQHGMTRAEGCAFCLEDNDLYNAVKLEQGKEE